MTLERLGVVVPVHGPLDPVLPLLEDLLGGDVAPQDRPARVLLVDDASPRPIDPAEVPAGVEVLRRERNGGFGAAVNTGLAALAEGTGAGAGAESPGPGPGTRHAGASDPGPTPAHVDLALVLNSDLRLPAGFARDLLAHAAPWQPAVVGVRSADAEGRSGYAARRFPTVGHQVVEWLVPLASQRHRDLLHRAVGHDLAAERGHGMVPVDWVSGAVLLLPLAEVRRLGGFDEGYFMYAEEVDLQLRLRREGIPSLLDADLQVTHVGGGSAGSEARRRRWLVGARMRYARKHGSVDALRAGMTAATAANLVWNTGRRAAGRDVAPLAAAREELSLIHRAGRELPR